jgi:hypothetical protein
MTSSEDYSGDCFVRRQPLRNLLRSNVRIDCVFDIFVVQDTVKPCGGRTDSVRHHQASWQQDHAILRCETGCAPQLQRTVDHLPGWSPQFLLDVTPCAVRSSHQRSANNATKIGERLVYARLRPSSEIRRL